MEWQSRVYKQLPNRFLGWLHHFTLPPLESGGSVTHGFILGEMASHAGSGLWGPGGGAVSCPDEGGGGGGEKGLFPETVWRQSPQELNTLKKEARREAGMYNSIDIKFSNRQNKSIMLASASCGCCYKLPQILWLKIIQTYFLTVLGVRSVKLISPGATMSVWAGLRSLWRLQGREGVSVPLSASRGVLVPWLVASSSTFKASSLASSIFKSLSNSPASLLKGPL